MSETRARVRNCIYDNPGIHFNAVGRKLDIATGQTQYHLRKLTRAEKVTKEGVYGRTHYFPPTFSEWERGVIALLRRETSREIVLLLLRAAPLPPAEIADRLDLARSTVEWHLSRLVEYEIAEKRTRANELVITLTEDEEIYRLLREIEPRLVDRVVDRFSRFADDLLDG
ncbi:MAG: winged helix-turn-helix transcriptional regulator [Halovenus sp.]|uniref:winged helix-turn-helix transcriptional regulator n=1 Tax=Halovenus amylolytica TaxID=2500550 RepID=UPI000FE3F0F4